MSPEIRIKEIQKDIKVSGRAEEIYASFSNEIINLHSSNPSLYNYIFKKTNSNILSLFMICFYLSNKKKLNDFYTKCIVLGYSGKNKAMDIIGFFHYGGKIEFIRKDRRSKTPELTEDGISVHNKIARSVFIPLTIYDQTLCLKESLSDKSLSHYYTNLKVNSPESKDWYELDEYLTALYSKTSGMIFLLKIYLDIINKDIRTGGELRTSYFTDISMDIGISASHAYNLLGILMDGGAAIKKGRHVFITDKFITDAESFISLYLATVYFYLRE